jgi:hypothetical protein
VAGIPGAYNLSLDGGGVMKRLRFCCLIVFIANFSAFGTTIYVPSQYPSIQEAIDFSMNGDIVLVSPGLYHENINFGSRSIILASEFLNNQDTSYIVSTIIDGSQSGSVITINHGEDSTTQIIGLTIRNGHSATYGGGIYIDSSSALISYCRILGNTADSAGGGAECRSSGSVKSSYLNQRFEQCDISGNTSPAGAGLSFAKTTAQIAGCNISANIGAGIFAHRSGQGNNWEDICDITIIDDTIEYNASDGIASENSAYRHVKSITRCKIDNNNGCGINFRWGLYQEFAYRKGKSITENAKYMQNCTIEGNSGIGLFTAGGIDIYTIDSCIFKGNQNGGILVSVDDGIDVINSSFIDNVAIDSSNWQGPSAAVSSTLGSMQDCDFDNCIFSGNTGWRAGGIGGIYAPITISNCTFTNNSSGQAQISPGYAGISINNSIVAFGADGKAIFSYDYYPASISCTNIYGNEGGDWTDSLAQFQDSIGNLSVDPLFCNAVSGDFHIRSTSLCAPQNNSCDSLIGALGIGCYEIADFHLISPRSDTVYIQSPNSYTWSKSKEAYLNQDASYRFYINTDSFFVSPDSSDILSDTTYVPSMELARSIRYYWKVLASISETPPKWSLETGNFYLDGYPSMPTLLQPINGTIADSNRYLIWLASTDPDSFDSLHYSLQIAIDSAFVSPVIDLPTVAPSSIQGDTLGIKIIELANFDTLEAAAGYYWRIKSGDRYSLTSEWTEGWQFVYVPQSIGIDLISPDSGVVLTEPQVDFTWHRAANIDSSVEIHYIAYWDNDPEFLSLDSSQVLTDTVFTPADSLMRSRRYYWKVTALGDQTATFESRINSFYIDAYPSGVSLISPIGGNPADSTTSLIWDRAEDPDSLDVITYKLQICANPEFDSLNIDLSGIIPQIVGDSAFILLSSLVGFGNLLPDTVYYWRIKADDPFGLSSDWETGSFEFLPHIYRAELWLEAMSIEDTLNSGLQDTIQVVIGNTGDGAMTLNIIAAETSLSLTNIKNQFESYRKNNGSNIPELSISWLFVQPDSAIIAPFDSLILNIIFNTGGLFPGTYNGQLEIRTNDLDDSLVILPVALFVDTSRCSYIVGDINASGVANGIDVTYGVAYFKGGNPPPIRCDICPEPQPFYAAADVNGTCSFNGIDITYFVSYFKGGDILRYCPSCPPVDVIPSAPEGKTHRKF